MFSRKSCYFFVRPKRSFLEVCVFLGRALKAPQVRRADPASKTKFAHLIQIRHRDEVEAPITDWLREAYDTIGRARREANTRPPAPKKTRKAVKRREAGGGEKTRRQRAAAKKAAARKGAVKKGA